MGIQYLFRLCNHIFGGVALSCTYGALTGLVIWIWQINVFERYLYAYAISFNCLASGGLVIATALFVHQTKSSITDIIEATFETQQLEHTDYARYKRKYLSFIGAFTFSANYAVAGFLTFYLAKFPFTGLAEIFLIVFACAEYALSVYVGRKLYFIAYMLYSISSLQPPKDTFRNGCLNQIISYVNILSTTTVIFVYAEVKGFYYGPFLYTSPLGHSLQLLMLLGAFVATPVIVLFNFYPRVVVKDIYERSIRKEVERLTEHLRSAYLSDFERMSYAIEYDRLQRDELKSRLQLTLSDLPMAITIVIAIVGLLVKS